MRHAVCHCLLNEHDNDVDDDDDDDDDGVAGVLASRDKHTNGQRTEPLHSPLEGGP